MKATQFVEELKAQEQNEEARKTLLEQKLNPYFKALMALGLPNDLAQIQFNNQDQDLNS